MSSSIPVQSVHHIEDVGHLLLEAQQDLARVRQRLEAMPLENQPGLDLGRTPSSLNVLRDLLNQTESNLRSKAEAVLKSVEHNKLNTLPAVTAVPVGMGLGVGMGGGGRAGGMGGEFNLASTFVQENAIVPAVPSRGGGINTILSSPPGRRQVSAGQLQHMRRPVSERMQEARSMELLARAPNEGMLAGPAREFVAAKYGLDAGASRSAAGRPVDRYAGHGNAWRTQKLHKGPLHGGANVLPSIYRRNPHAYPPIQSADADQGIINLVNRGMIPSFVDVTAAFAARPAPLSQAPSRFHQHADQFKRSMVATTGASSGFNLASVKLDLGDTILDGGRTEAEEPPKLQMEEKQDTVILPSTQFDFPRLMPGSDDDRPPEPAPEEPQVDDLLTAHLDAALPTLDADGKIREYDELLDAYSLHQFLIRKGKTLSSTPEFTSFARKYQARWGAVKSIIAALEKICREYRIQMATISGERVVALAEEEGVRQLTPQALFSCFQVDLESGHMDPMLKALLSAPTAFRYKVGGDMARLLATLKLQATYRMSVQRRLYLAYRHQASKAVVIQRAWRRFQRLQRTRALIAARWSERLSAWQSNIQDPFKRSWGTWTSRKRVLVHVPSVSTEPYQRAHTFNFPVRQNAQLSRLCDAKDPDVDVVYLSPFALNTDVQAYYLKLLEVGGVSNVQSRVKVLVPENATRFPEHFSLAKLALYSPRLLKKIREVVRGRPAAIVPGEVGPEDLQLAVELNLPLLGATPETVALFGSKSGSKRIFAASEVSVAPGAHDIYDASDLYAYLARLMVDHMSVDRWLLKIDNESGGRGVAVVETQSFKIMQSLRAEKAAHANRWLLPEVIANAHERVSVALRKSLAKKATLATPDLYDNNFLHYLAAFFRVGGAIEAVPHHILGSPSVNLFIEPDGSVNVLNSHDQVFSTPFVFGGCVFPSSAPSSLIHSPALAIGRQCAREGVIGYVGVDFVVWADTTSSAMGGGGMTPKLWAVDLNIKCTASQAAFMMFDFLNKGRYVYQPNLLTARAGGKEEAGRMAAKYLVPCTPLAVNTSGAGSSSSRSNLSSARTAGGALMRTSTGSPATRMFASPEASRPTSGSSTPKLPELARNGSWSSSMRSNASLTSAAAAAAVKEEERFYACIPYLYQPHLSTVQFGSFFNLCRLRGLSFDVKARLGTAFMLLDSLASGTVGLMCVGQGQGTGAAGAGGSAVAVAAGIQLPSSPLHALQLMVDALSFLTEQVSSLRFGAHLYDAESNLAALSVSFKQLLKAQKEASQIMLLEQHAQLMNKAAGVGAKESDSNF